MLMARLAAEKPLEESTALLADVAVSAHGRAGPHGIAAHHECDHRCLERQQWQRCRHKVHTAVSMHHLQSR